MVADGLQYGEGGDSTKANAVRAIAKELEDAYDHLMDTVSELNRLKL